jgi:MFS family permease
VARAEYHHEVDDAEVARLLAPRDDLLLETPLERTPDSARFGCEEGPFAHYERSVTVDDSDGAHRVTETIDFSLAIPVFGFLFVKPVKWTLAPSRPRRVVGDPDGGAHTPWWSPPDRLDLRAANVLGLICGLSVAAGYLGALLSQTIDIAADDFGATNADQGDVLSAARIGVVIAMVVIAVADRKGRRRALVAALQIGALVMATTAIAPNLLAFGVSQTLARGFITASFVLLGILAVEEMPAGSRAYAVSVMAMSGALGAGMVLWLLPVADIDPAAWRVLYVMPLIWFVVVRRLARDLPESQRFELAEQTDADDVASHTADARRSHRRRLALLASSQFLFQMFLAPSSQYLVGFLRDDRDFSSLQVVLFQILTNLPGGIGIVVGGRLADTRGRRIVGSIGLLVGVATTAYMFNVTGWSMWVASLIGSLVGAAVVPALGVYGPELFPTNMRGRANSVLTLLGVAGAVFGLQVAGRLSDQWGSLGQPIALLALGPVVLAVLVIAFYPETAHRELEDINPEDVALRDVSDARPDHPLGDR